jgi:hypothetical protein
VCCFALLSSYIGANTFAKINQPSSDLLSSVPVDPAQLKELVDAKGVEEDEHCRDNSIDKVWRRN